MIFLDHFLQSPCNVNTVYAGYILTTMVISCVAYGCINRVGKGCDISFHRHVFMLKD